MAKHSTSSSSDNAKDNFNKLIAANRKAALRNNVVLLEACTNGKLNYIKTSIDAGADVHYTTDDNETPLLRCCNNLSPLEAEKCIKYLMKRGADTNYQDKYGRTTLSYISEKGNNLIVDVLITKCDADPTIEDVKGNTPLMYAVSSGSLDIVATIVGYFLVMNIPIDKRNLVGNTPLLLAAKMGKYDCAKMLVEVGAANIHLRDVHAFRSAVDWIRVTSPQNLQEFMELDPIVVRKRESALRRLSGDKTRYRILSDFFPVGKMPSCWRSSGKGSQEPRKHVINRTICIVADEDNDKDTENTDSPDYEEAIDNILTNLAEPSPLPPITDIAPRSMFDIPNLNEIRAMENSGRFVERSDSALSVASAPSPTFPQIDDVVYDDIASSPPPQGKPPLSVETARKMERRRSIDNSLLSRAQTHSPLISSPVRRNSRSNTHPLNENRAQTSADAMRRISSDPLRNARIPTDALRSPDALRSAKLATDPIASTKITRSGRQCKKTSLPNINKNNHIVRADSYVHT